MRYIDSLIVILSRDVVTKAIDLFVKKQSHSYDLNDQGDDVVRDDEVKTGTLS